jgi:hypothetical protein
MKVVLMAVFETGANTEKLLSNLSADGYNGTVIASSSIKHLLYDKNEDVPAFISLSKLNENNFVANTTLYVVVEEEKLAKLKADIRDYTSDFKKIKGGMFVLPVVDFEGSF